MKEEIDSFLSGLLSGFTDLLPRLIMAIVVILIGFVIGKLVKKLVRRLILFLNKSLNERLQERMLNVDFKGSATFIAATFFWIIITISVLIAIRILSLDFFSEWFDKIVSYLPNILVAVVIIFIGLVAGRLLGDLIQSAASRTGIANGKFLGRSLRYLVIFIAIVIAVGQLGVNIIFLTNLFIIILASLLFGASLAFGLGAKTSVSNILGSYYVRKSHQLGTTIMLGDLVGTIVKITDHAVSLETNTGLVVVPAKEFNETRITIIKDQSK
ncbi:mechanosensitive ion channel family protein [Ekhidna sp. To15]|uniref:mechanosensitive ion channel family protein n=1 Tax=Ekhidna sp. To15 TaxID=3395267 RepID=UPI003F51BA04